MRCIFCSNATRVTDKRGSPEGIRRRRECLKCKKRFTTYEKAQEKEIIVVKKDGRREKFFRDKIKNGIVKACEKRSISTEEIDKIIDEIENKLINRKEVKSGIIGKMVMQKLRKLDKIAYIRFASVYREFKDVKDFNEVIKEF